jgi:hypothetical protein
MKRQRKGVMRSKRGTMKHWSALTVAESIHQKKRMSAGNLRKTKHLAQPIGIVEKHLKVCRVLNRNIDAAARTRDIK